MSDDEDDATYECIRCNVIFASLRDACSHFFWFHYATLGIIYG